MTQLRRIGLIIDLEAAVVAVLACLSVLACRKMGWTAGFPLALVATAVIFPIVFSIGGA